MRKTPLKRGISQMKRGKLRRKSKSEITKVQDTLWEHCKRITRARYGNTCYTCGKTGLEGSGWHTGHMWSKAALPAFLKYDIRILRPQCYDCNMNKGGMGADFFRRMCQENGEEYMMELYRDRQVEVRALEHYQKLIIEYSQLT